jgi:hypothetical protein
LFVPKAIVPASADAGSDRRHGDRHVAVMRVAILHTAHGEELCLVRNISDDGLKARIWSDLNVGDPLTAEFKSGDNVSGTVVWRREDHIGVQFTETQDHAAILSGDEDPPAGFQPRAPRVHLETPGRIRVGARYHRVMLSDISQGGAKVRLGPPDRWEEGAPSLVLTLGGLPPIDGTLRWHDAEVAGITFNTKIPLDTLAGWIVARHG